MSNNLIIIKIKQLLMDIDDIHDYEFRIMKQMLYDNINNCDIIVKYLYNYNSNMITTDNHHNHNKIISSSSSSITATTQTQYHKYMIMMYNYHNFLLFIDIIKVLFERYHQIKDYIKINYLYFISSCVRYIYIKDLDIHLLNNKSYDHHHTTTTSSTDKPRIVINTSLFPHIILSISMKNHSFTKHIQYIWEKVDFWLFIIMKKVKDDMLILNKLIYLFMKNTSMDSAKDGNDDDDDDKRNRKGLLIMELSKFPIFDLTSNDDGDDDDDNYVDKRHNYNQDHHHQNDYYHFIKLRLFIIVTRIQAFITNMRDIGLSHSKIHYILETLSNKFKFEQQKDDSNSSNLSIIMIPLKIQFLAHLLSCFINIFSYHYQHQGDKNKSDDDIKGNNRKSDGNSHYVCIYSKLSSLFKKQIHQRNHISNKVDKCTEIIFATFINYYYYHHPHDNFDGRSSSSNSSSNNNNNNNRFIDDVFPLSYQLGYSPIIEILFSTYNEYINQYQQYIIDNHIYNDNNNDNGSRSSYNDDNYQNENINNDIVHKSKSHDNISSHTKYKNDDRSSSNSSNIRTDSIKQNNNRHVNFSEQKENNNDDDDDVDHKVVEKLKNNICFCGIETNNWSFVSNDSHTINNDTYNNNANKHHYRQNFNRDDNYDNNYKNEINFLNITTNINILTSLLCEKCYRHFISNPLLIETDLIQLTNVCPLWYISPFSSFHDDNDNIYHNDYSKTNYNHHHQYNQRNNGNGIYYNIHTHSFQKINSIKSSSSSVPASSNYKMKFKDLYQNSSHLYDTLHCPLTSTNGVSISTVLLPRNKSEWLDFENNITSLFEIDDIENIMMNNISKYEYHGNDNVNNDDNNSKIYDSNSNNQNVNHSNNYSDTCTDNNSCNVDNVYNSYAYTNRNNSGDNNSICSSTSGRSSSSSSSRRSSLYSKSSSVVCNTSICGNNGSTSKSISSSSGIDRNNAQNSIIGAYHFFSHIHYEII